MMKMPIEHPPPSVLTTDDIIIIVPDDNIMDTSIYPPSRISLLLLFLLPLHLR